MSLSSSKLEWKASGPTHLHYSFLIVVFSHLICITLIHPLWVYFHILTHTPLYTQTGIHNDRGREKDSLTHKYAYAHGELDGSRTRRYNGTAEGASREEMTARFWTLVIAEAEQRRCAMSTAKGAAMWSQWVVTSERLRVLLGHGGTAEGEGGHGHARPWWRSVVQAKWEMEGEGWCASVIAEGWGRMSAVHGDGHREEKHGH